MWIKTRFGLVRFAGDVDIYLSRSQKEDGTRTVSVYTLRPLAWQEDASTTILAAFPDDASGEEGIRVCLSRIEEAILNEAPLCDLSDLGDAHCWDDGWEDPLPT